MTFVGKLLVVILMALSVCFMAFAGAVFTVQANWKHEAKGLEQNLSDLKIAKKDDEEEFKQFKDDINIVLENERNRADAAEANARILTQKTAVQNTEIITIKTERDTQRQLAIIAGTEASERRNEAIAQRLVNENLHKELNNLITKAGGLEDENFNFDIERKTMLVKHDRLLDQLRALQMSARAHGFDADPKELAKQATPPPLVAGLVLETKEGDRSGSDLVEISIGSDDGLSKGHTLSVYRTGQTTGRAPKYLGDIRLLYVTSDRSVGAVVLRAKNGVIERGDNVTTKI